MSDLYKRTLDYFNDEASYHHQEFHIENPSNQKRLEALVNPLVEEIERPLLEVGCGVGDSGLLYLPDVAVDFSPAMVEQAKKLLPDSKVLVASALDLPFEDDEFSTVISVAMLQHTMEPKTAIAEMVRVAKDKIIIVTNHVNTYSQTLKPFMVHRFSKVHLEDLLKDYDYSIAIQDRSSIIRIKK